VSWSSAVIDYSKQQSVGTCNTPECIRAASVIIQNMSRNKSIDPCQNIEEMVCGGFREHHDYRPDQGAVFTGTLMAEQSQLKLRHILEAGYPKDSEVLSPASSDGVLLTIPSIQISPPFVSLRLRNQRTSRTSTK